MLKVKGTRFELHMARNGSQETPTPYRAEDKTESWRKPQIQFLHDSVLDTYSFFNICNLFLLLPLRKIQSIEDRQKVVPLQLDS